MKFTPCKICKQLVDIGINGAPKQICKECSDKRAHEQWVKYWNQKMIAKIKKDIEDE